MPKTEKVLSDTEIQILYFYNMEQKMHKTSSSVAVDVNVLFPAGHHVAAGGGELPASVSQRDAAGQQRGVHEGEGQQTRSVDVQEI